MENTFRGFPEAPKQTDIFKIQTPMWDTAMRSTSLGRSSLVSQYAD